MTACAVAALTVYDMVKGIERGVEIAEIVLLEKTGGKEDWRRERGRRRLGAPADELGLDARAGEAGDERRRCRSPRASGAAR